MLEVATSSVSYDQYDALPIVSVSKTGKRDRDVYIATDFLLSSLGGLKSRPIAFRTSRRGLSMIVHCGGNRFSVIKFPTGSCILPNAVRGGIGTAVRTSILGSDVNGSLCTINGSSLHPVFYNVCFAGGNSRLRYTTAGNSVLMQGVCGIRSSKRRCGFLLRSETTGVIHDVADGSSRGIRMFVASHRVTFRARASCFHAQLVRKECPGCGTIVPASDSGGTVLSGGRLLTTIEQMDMFTSGTHYRITVGFSKLSLILSKGSVSYSARTRRAMFYTCRNNGLHVNFGTRFLGRALRGVAAGRMRFGLDARRHTNIVAPMASSSRVRAMTLVVPVLLST